MKNFFFYTDTNFFLNFKNFLQSREQTDAEVANSVSSVIEDVKVNKDAAVVKYTKRFDKINLERTGLFYGPNEIRECVNDCNLKDKEAIDLSISRILEFHKKQMPSNLNWKDTLGIELGWIWKPIDRVGVYVPGGKASYPSSAIMNIAPAKIAGVKDIVLATPSPNGFINPLIIYASFAMNITKILRIGGAQAIAAMAFGTETVEKVNKITGPGNEYVAEAKKFY